MHLLDQGLLNKEVDKLHVTSSGIGGSGCMAKAG